MTKKCFNHEKTDAVAECSSCGKSFCSDCLQKSGGNYYCFHHGCQLVLKIDEQRKPQVIAKSETIELKKASFMLRALNFIIDIVVFRAIMSLSLDQFFSKQFIDQQDITTNDWMLFLLEIILFVIYFFLFEILFQKTPGKFLTRTKVVNLNGYKPKILTILLRSILRFLPFEVFSISFNDKTWWHDRLSKTIVVQDIPPVNNYEENDIDE